MKLRNKKTGLIYSHFRGQKVVLYLSYKENDWSTFEYRSLAELNEEWEEYESADPLIEDEGIREIIKSWAKVNGATELKYYEGENCLEDIFRNEIHFNQALGLEDAKTYTIAELCGEEEECLDTN